MHLLAPRRMKGSTGYLADVPLGACQDFSGVSGVRYQQRWYWNSLLRGHSEADERRDVVVCLSGKGGQCEQLFTLVELSVLMSRLRT